MRWKFISRQMMTLLLGRSAGVHTRKLYLSAVDRIRPRKMLSNFDGLRHDKVDFHVLSSRLERSVGK